MAQEFLVFCFMLMNGGDKRRGKQTKPNHIIVCEFNAASWRKHPARGWYIHPARGWCIHIQQSSNWHHLVQAADLYWQQRGLFKVILNA